MRIKDIALIGMMSAILIAVQVALGFLPNVELVSLLIILYTLTFGRKAAYIIYVFVALEGIIYGIGLWWINYLYVWTVLFIITMLFRKVHSTLIWSAISGLFGLSFGALCSIPYFIAGGIPSGLAYWVAGIPFDITHGIANFVVSLVLFYPLHNLLENINKRTEYMST
jgi:energy-coupling factor transport system substrate-specific component